MGRSWLALDTEPQGVLFAIVKELGSSLLAGAVLGAVLILYIRFVKVEMLLFVAGIILVVSELGRPLHLELLLVFITAGFVVRNFSKHEHELMSAVEMVSLPVFVVFFTIAGAGLDLVATWQVLPLALGLCSVLAWQLKEAMKKDGVSKNEMAKRMQTSRSQLDRILDPDNDKIQLDTVFKAAQVLGREVKMELV
jgi:hypothetical protein